MYGAKISSIRLARGYTQEYMAKKLGMEQTTYSKIEHDVKAMDKETVQTMLKLLDSFQQQMVNQNKLLELLLEKKNSSI